MHNPFSLSPSSGNTPCQSPATSSAGLATRMPSVPRLLPRGQRPRSLQARSPLHSSAPGLGCPTCESQGWFLRVVTQQWSSRRWPGRAPLLFPPPILNWALPGSWPGARMTKSLSFCCHHTRLFIHWVQPERLAGYLQWGVGSKEAGHAQAPCPPSVLAERAAAQLGAGGVGDVDSSSL